MNRLLIFCFAFMAVTPFVWRFFHKPPVAEKTNMVKKITKEKNAVPVQPARLHSFGSRLKQFAGDNGYNTHFCFLVDMKIESVNNRFFVYDTQHDSVLYAGLVAHGYGNSNGENITFSNVPGSNSTSLGKYKIGNAYFGKFGLAYKLYGLEKTNSNAFNRFVVLHAHECVPDAEIGAGHLCMSQGCPTVSTSFLKKLARYLDDADKPVLLWIYN